VASENQYATAAEIKEMILGIEDNAPYNDDTKIESKITDAERVINNALISRYAVPFSSDNVPPLINQLTKELASYYILRTIYTRDNVEKSEWVQEYKTNVDKQLQDLVTRKINLIDANGDLVGESEASVESNTEDYTPTFDVDEPENWKQDEDKLDDISDARD